MKNIFLFTLTICMAISSKAMHKQRKMNQLQQDTLISYFTSMNLAQFSNLPIDSFLTKIPQNFTSLKIHGGGRMDRAGIFSIKYNSNVYVDIRVLEFTHMDPTNPNKIPPDQRWSTALMRKEKVYSIRIYNGNTLINHFNEDY